MSKDIRMGSQEDNDFFWGTNMSKQCHSCGVPIPDNTIPAYGTYYCDDCFRKLRADADDNRNYG